MGAYPLVLKHVSEPIRILATAPEKPVDVWQAAQQSPCADVVTDLTRGHKEVQRTAFAVADGVAYVFAPSTPSRISRIASPILSP